MCLGYFVYMAFNFIFGGRSHALTLEGMHSGVGTKIFKRLSSNQQQSWSAYDRNMSRLRMRRMEGQRPARSGRRINLIG